LAAAAVVNCERPLSTTDPITSVARVVISPHSVTLQPNELADFTAASFTAAGDSSPVGILWHATSGVVSDTGTTGHRHYGRYKNASCGDYLLIASNSPGWRSDSAKVAVRCPVAVASVAVSPASVALQAGQTVQLAATPQDTGGNPLAGRVVTWASNTTAVATVAASGLVTGVAARRGGAAMTVERAPVPVASVGVAPGSATMQAGQTVQLAATPKDVNGNPLSGRVVTWASSTPAVATVDASGLVTSVAAGSATITATSEGQSGTALISVTAAPVASVAVTPAAVGLQPGGTVQLTATPKDANGNPLTGRGVVWTSSTGAVATVGSSGLVTAVATGGATITATSEGQSGTASITVPPVPVATVAVTPASASVDEGKTVQLTATPKDAAGNPLSGRVVTWTSSNTAAATVNSSGLVTAKLAGAATITATSEGQSGTSAITVVHVAVAWVAVAPASASVKEGQTVQLVATLKDGSGNTLTGRTVSWASSNTAAATVTGSGLVSGVTAGTATITATSETVSGTAAVTVTAASAGGQFGHVFVVTEENTDYADVTTSSMPYLMGLAAQYGLATQYYANTHPSIGNYFELAT